jgi:hypothetical protein
VCAGHQSSHPGLAQIGDCIGAGALAWRPFNANVHSAKSLCAVRPARLERHSEQGATLNGVLCDGNQSNDFDLTDRRRLR